MIVAIGHKARQGKDTLAQMIQEMYNGECHILHWADALYEEVENKNASESLVYRQGSEFHFIDGTIAPVGEYPELLKIFDDRWITDYDGMIKKDAPMLQFWGTNYRRKQDPDYWVKKLMDKIKNLQGLILIPDTRFTNEYKAAKENGLYIGIQRFNADGSRFVAHDRDPNHPSETDLDYAKADYEIKAHSKCLHVIREQAYWFMKEYGLPVKEIFEDLFYE